MRTLLVEDDIDLGQAIVEHLETAGHDTHWCKLLEQAREAPPPELVLLDLALPDGDGIELLREWQASGQRWCVIVLTARDQVSDRIRGLQAGADDYLVKPFSLDELLARVDAVCRRVRSPQQISTDTLCIDIEGRQLRVRGEPVTLTAMEWAVFGLLATNMGRIVSRRRIELALESAGLAAAESNSLEVIVSRLRRKLGSHPIRTIRGLGYALDGDAG